jgi:hypothetical protein
MDEDKIKAVILDSVEVSLEAQLRAVRRLRGGAPSRNPLVKVCPRQVWHMTYSDGRASPCMSRRSLSALRPSTSNGWTANRWSRPWLRKSGAKIVSCAPVKMCSDC